MIRSTVSLWKNHIVPTAQGSIEDDPWDDMKTITQAKEFLLKWGKSLEAAEVGFIFLMI